MQELGRLSGPAFKTSEGLIVESFQEISSMPIGLLIGFLFGIVVRIKGIEECKVSSTRISLVVQWLKLHTLNAGGLGLIPGQEAGSHMPQLRHGAAK